MRILPLFIVIAITAVSCAGSIAPERLRPITGVWRTEQGMEVVIGPGDDQGYTATIKTSPGFTGGGMGPGSVIMRNIRAYADGSFTGTFLVPDADAAKVRMALVSPSQLVIVTRDKRIRGGTMIWRRVR